jgi:uncharacterized protein
VRGTCSMARKGDPDSANSQFFICFDDARFLDGQYTCGAKSRAAWSMSTRCPRASRRPIRARSSRRRELRWRDLSRWSPALRPGSGVEFARQLSKWGHRLVLAARRKDRLEALATELGNSRAIAIDLGEKGSAARLIDEIESAGEQVHVLVNNAGFGLSGRFAKLDPERQRQMIDLNVRTLTDLCRAVLPTMIERRAAESLTSLRPQPSSRVRGMAVYFATKAYVLSFTEALHEEVKPHGVRVSALCPGPTRTEFGEVAGFDDKGAFDRLAMDVEPVVRAGLDGLDGTRRWLIPGSSTRPAPCRRDSCRGRSFARSPERSSFDGRAFNRRSTAPN